MLGDATSRRRVRPARCASRTVRDLDGTHNLWAGVIERIMLGVAIPAQTSDRYTGGVDLAILI